MQTQPTDSTAQERMIPWFLHKWRCSLHQWFCHRALAYVIAVRSKFNTLRFLNYLASKFDATCCIELFNIHRLLLYVTVFRTSQIFDMWRNIAKLNVDRTDSMSNINTTFNIYRT